MLIVYCCYTVPKIARRAGILDGRGAMYSVFLREVALVYYKYCLPELAVVSKSHSSRYHTFLLFYKAEDKSIM